MTAFTLSSGFTTSERGTIARLYWSAFSAKLGRLLGPDETALAFFTQIMNPEYAITARDSTGAVIGVAGFKTSKGALTGGGMRDIARHYGWFGALWRAPLLALLERELNEDTLLMDGICVDATARGRGIGTALLNAIKAEATARGLRHVRLDVIDINARARALYVRQGFVAGPEQNIGPLHLIFGFSSSTPMTWTV